MAASSSDTPKTRANHKPYDWAFDACPGQAPQSDVYFDQAALGVEDWAAVQEPYLKKARAIIVVCTPGSNGMPAISEINRCLGIDSLEPSAKMRTIGEATFAGNSRHRLVGVDQQPVTIGKAHISPDCCWWFTRVLVKGAVELALGGIKLLRELMNFKRCGNMSFHNIHGMFHAPVPTNR